MISSSSVPELIRSANVGRRTGWSPTSSRHWANKSSAARFQRGYRALKFLLPYALLHQSSLRHSFLNQIRERLRALAPHVLQGIRRGIEKESLRVGQNGKLAMTPHPLSLGSALTHAHITTDFSESQPELITGVHRHIDECLD